MALPVKDQIKYWTVAAALLLIFLWLLGDILLPFVLGAALAYLLDPIVDRLERIGTGRILGTTLVLAAAFLVIFFIFILLIPLAFDQMRLFATAAPDLLIMVQKLVVNQLASISPGSEALNSTLSKFSTIAQEKLGLIFGSLMASAISIIDIIMLMVITPVVAVYLLVDWDRILLKINDLLPLDHAPVVRSLAAEIDSTLSARIRPRHDYSLPDTWRLLCNRPDNHRVRIWAYNWVDSRFGELHSFCRCFVRRHFSDRTSTIAILGRISISGFSYWDIYCWSNI